MSEPEHVQDLVAVGGLLARTHDLLDRRRPASSGPASAQTSASSSPNCTNETRRRAMLRDAPAPARRCARTVGRQASGDQPRRACGRRRVAAAATDRGARGARASRMPGCPTARRGSAPAARAAVCSLSRIWPAVSACALERDDRARGRARDDVLAVRSAHKEGVERAAVHAGRHAQDDGAGAGADPADQAQRATHRRRRACRSEYVLLAREPQEQRVAAELQAASPPRRMPAPGASRSTR